MFRRELIVPDPRKISSPDASVVNTSGIPAFAPESRGLKLKGEIVVVIDETGYNQLVAAGWLPVENREADTKE